jgi:hypothetical protein
MPPIFSPRTTHSYAHWQAMLSLPTFAVLLFFRSCPTSSMPLASNAFHALFPDFLFEPGSDCPEPSMLKTERGE